MNEQKVYSFSYTKNLAHYKELCAFARKQMTTGKSRLLLGAAPAIIIFSLGVTIPILFKMDAIEIKQIALVSGISILLYILCLSLITNSMTSSSLSKDGLFYAPTTMKLSAHGVEEISEFCATTYRWNCIKDYTENNDSLLLFVDKAMAVVLPKSVIANDQEVEELKTFISDQINKHKP